MAATTEETSELYCVNVCDFQGRTLEVPAVQPDRTVALPTALQNTQESPIYSPFLDLADGSAIIAFAMSPGSLQPGAGAAHALAVDFSAGEVMWHSRMGHSWANRSEYMVPQLQDMVKVESVQYIAGNAAIHGGLSGRGLLLVALSFGQGYEFDGTAGTPGSGEEGEPFRGGQDNSGAMVSSGARARASIGGAAGRMPTAGTSTGRRAQEHEATASASAGMIVGTAASLVALDAGTGELVGSWVLQCNASSPACQFYQALFNLSGDAYNGWHPTLGNPQQLAVGGPGRVSQPGTFPRAEGPPESTLQAKDPQPAIGLAYILQGWLHDASWGGLPAANLGPGQYPWKLLSQAPSVAAAYGPRMRARRVASSTRHTEFPRNLQIDPSASPSPLPHPPLTHRCGGYPEYIKCIQHVLRIDVVPAGPGSVCDRGSQGTSTPMHSGLATRQLRGETGSALGETGNVDGPSVCFKTVWLKTVPGTDPHLLAVPSASTAGSILGAGGIMVSSSALSGSLDDDIDGGHSGSALGLPSCQTTMLDWGTGRVRWEDAGGCLAGDVDLKAEGFILGRQMSGGLLMQLDATRSIVYQTYAITNGDPFFGGTSSIGLMGRDPASGHLWFNDLVLSIDDGTQLQVPDKGQPIVVYDCPDSSGADGKADGSTGLCAAIGVQLDPGQSGNQPQIRSMLVRQLGPGEQATVATSAVPVPSLHPSPGFFATALPSASPSASGVPAASTTSTPSASASAAPASASASPSSGSTATPSPSGGTRPPHGGGKGPHHVGAIVGGALGGLFGLGCVGALGAWLLGWWGGVGATGGLRLQREVSGALAEAEADAGAGAGAGQGRGSTMRDTGGATAPLDRMLSSGSVSGLSSQPGDSQADYVRLDD